MAEYDYDLLVVGAGSGGVRASRIAAGHGARVAICEDSRVGGTCVIRGCIPKKLLVYGAHFRHDFEDSLAYGWQPRHPTLDWPTLIANKDTEIDRLNGIYIKLLRDAGVELVPGRGRLIDAHTVQVGERLLSAGTILIATGGAPYLPPIPGIEHAISSNEALDLATLPRRVVVVGGGYIAVEFANIFTGAGAQVIQIIRGEELLNGFDDDVRVELARQMRTQGVEIHTRRQVVRIERHRAGLNVVTDHGEAIEADAVLYATGRRPNTAGMGLEEAGVELGRNGAIRVDDFSQTTVANIYAVGDATDRLNLTPVAIREGHLFADSVFGGRRLAADRTNVATAVFSHPPIATVGLTEAQARRRHGPVDIYRTRFRPLKHTLTKREEFSLMKLVVDPASDRVLGCHMIGADAPEIIQGLAVALQCGATKAQFDATIGIHPTAAEEFVTLRTKLAEPAARAAE